MISLSVMSIPLIVANITLVNVLSVSSSHECGKHDIDNAVFFSNIAEPLGDPIVC
jgi:hypothetical protein